MSARRGLNSYEYKNWLGTSMTFSEFLHNKIEDEKRQVGDSPYKDWKEHGYNENAELSDTIKPESWWLQKEKELSEDS